MLRLHGQAVQAACVLCTMKAYLTGNTLAHKQRPGTRGCQTGSPALEETRAMANVTYTARPYIPGQMLGELVGRFVMATCAFAGALRDAYAAERKEIGRAHV